MHYFLLGLAALIVGLLLINWFANTSTENAKKLLVVTGALLLFVLALVLLFTGRILAAIPSAVVAWTLWRRSHTAFNLFQSASSWRNRAQGGGSRDSTVETDWIAMVLDHGSGTLDGHVRKGRHAGKPLSALDRADLDALYAQLLDEDPDGARLLETYYRRRFGESPAGDARQDRAAASPSGPMTGEEACKVLGVGQGASEQDIRTAHRRLMKKLHPDQGGSDYFASKLNEAKDLLLKK